MEKNAWDDLFPEAQQQKAERNAKAFEFAQRYFVFSGPTADPRARELLEQWTNTVRKQRITPSASGQELAYWNARREFVEEIHAQIEFAHNRANQPN